MAYDIVFFSAMQEQAAAAIDAIWEERAGQWGIGGLTGPHGDPALGIGETGGDGWARKDIAVNAGLASPFSEFIIGAHVYFAAGAHTGDARLFSLYEGTGIHHMSIGWNNTPVDLKVFRATTQVGTTLDLNLALNTWYHIMFAGKIHDTTGYFEVFIDGVSTGAQTSLDTQNAGTGLANMFATGFVTAVSGNPLCRMANLYLAVGSPGTPPGLLRAKRNVVNVAGSNTDFAPLSSTNVSNVDEASTDGDTTYNESSTVGDIDTFGFDNIPTNATVYAVQTEVVARKTDAGVRTGKNVVRSGGTNYFGSVKTLHETYETMIGCRTVDPATSAAWTASAVNSLEVGYALDS